MKAKADEEAGWALEAKKRQNPNKTVDEVKQIMQDEAEKRRKDYYSAIGRAQSEAQRSALFNESGDYDDLEKVHHYDSDVEAGGGKRRTLHRRRTARMRSSRKRSRKSRSKRSRTKRSRTKRSRTKRR